MPTLAGATLDARFTVGVAAGIALGLANLAASRWTSRAAVARATAYHAVAIMMGGFLVRLMLLAAVILGIPRTWMNHDAFVITFLFAFMVGIAIEARSFLRTRVETEGSR